LFILLHSNLITAPTIGIVFIDVLKASIHKLPNILKSNYSLVVSMNINKIFGLCIMALMSIFVLTITAVSVTPAAIAQNMTGGNTTGQIGSSQAEVEAQCSLSPACIT
jgi:hypothetical protein